MTDAHLDDCGPIPYMDANMRQPDPEPAAVAVFAPRGVPPNKRWLYLTQIGDDFANCLTEPDSASTASKTYTFGEYIVVQCATYSENAADEGLCVTHSVLFRRPCLASEMLFTNDSVLLGYFYSLKTSAGSTTPPQIHN